MQNIIADTKKRNQALSNFDGTSTHELTKKLKATKQLYYTPHPLRAIYSTTSPLSFSHSIVALLFEMLQRLGILKWSPSFDANTYHVCLKLHTYLLIKIIEVFLKELVVFKIHLGRFRQISYKCGYNTKDYIPKYRTSSCIYSVYFCDIMVTWPGPGWSHDQKYLFVQN